MFKNTKKIGVVVPQLEFVPGGVHNIGVEVSLNGLQFTESGFAIRYVSTEGGFEEEKKKEDKKKPAKK